MGSIHEDAWMRWPVVRNLLLGLLVLCAVALAGKRKKDEEPPPTPEPATPVIELQPEPAEPPAPTAPPLFPDGLPVAVQKTPDGLASLSAQACSACHVQAHDDWAQGPHATAWRSETFQAAVARAGDTTGCKGCHLPLANQHARLAVGYLDGQLSRPDLQPNPLWDATLMSEGVTCAACHIRDGVVISTRAAPNAPHPVAVSAELGTSEFCATCHQLTWPGADKAFYDTYGEWKASAYAAAGVQCQDCHMPPTPGLAVATRFAATPSHRFPADPARALSVLVTLPAPEVQRGQSFVAKMRLQNTGAGHHIPTGTPFVGYTVEAALIGSDGKPLCEPWRVELARKVTPEAPWTTLSDTRLKAGEDRAAEHSFLVDQKKKAGAAMLRVALYRTGSSNPIRVLQELPLSLL